jgi:hypothetical protein
MTKRVLVAVEEDFDTAEVAQLLEKSGFAIEETKAVSGIVIGSTEDAEALRKIAGVFSVEDIKK